MLHECMNVRIVRHQCVYMESFYEEQNWQFSHGQKNPMDNGFQFLKQFFTI